MHQSRKAILDDPTIEKRKMPRITITLPKDIFDKANAIAKSNDESLSYTITRMTELGLLVTENQKKNQGATNLSEIESHCFKLIIQLNAIVKSMASKQLNFTQDDFDKLRDSAVQKYNDLIGLVPEEL